ncbi:hypothetical protein THRCLA_21111 [Thraustotheca clavata]|uniref:Uncharacterized protein n=1 Tax=Thraustotheca clavata TaxID=74557 RepID=A0A1W0A0B0_9STRA|nr:hypothetical protein THRCLA_21111 [Thraustotheca clavata]
MRSGVRRFIPLLGIQRSSSSGCCILSRIFRAHFSIFRKTHKTMEQQTRVQMPSDIDAAPVGKYQQVASITPIRTRSMSTNSYENDGPSKEITDKQQELFRMKHNVHESRSPLSAAASPHKIGQKAIVMPKAMAI